MRANEVKKDIVAQAKEQARQALRDREECVKGIREVCADITEEVNDRGEYTVIIQWTTSDGVSFRTYDTNTYAVKDIETLAKIWQCTEEELTDKAIEETREVFFYAMHYTTREGEPSEIQKFRRVNALDRAHATTEAMKESEGKA